LKTLQLDTAIEYLKGVGPVRGALLRSELEISIVRDLMYYYPFRYIDKTRFYKISELNPEMPFIQLKGKFLSCEEIVAKSGKRLVADFTDGHGIVELVWFQGIKWVKPKIKADTEYVIFGKPSLFKGKFNIAHPEVETLSEYNAGIISAFQPVYNSGEILKLKGLDSKGIMKLVANMFADLQEEVAESLSPAIINKHKLMPLSQALRQVHYPDNIELLKKARIRLKYDELFFVQLDLLGTRALRMMEKNGFVFSTAGSKLHYFYNNNLAFELTEAQKRVIREIRQDFGTGQQMNRMLQGDVGSGKTLVAIMTMLIAIDNGFQACLMAPTEVLAQQHFASFTKMLGNMDVSCGLLTGSTKVSERRLIHEALKNGSMNILIGTHAVLEDIVEFKNLGYVVIDEQHKFGVAQRAKLHKKNSRPPHILIMTATPIPRSLAMTFYGDLDTSVIDELPPGRKPIFTLHRTDKDRHKLHHFLKQQIKQGRQIYIVYPLIHESEKLDLKDLNEGYENLLAIFPRPDYQICVVHGKQKPKDKQEEMRRFVAGETHIMVSTTVIEVGVDVPNASVMVIENAERFGLSQLHQLRGRVGRGAEQSYCILMTKPELSQDAMTRMQAMVSGKDGFEIAEIDLRLRGPGDIGGTKQSGLNSLKIADLTKDLQILQLAKDTALEIVNNDPKLCKPENIILQKGLTKLRENNIRWSSIG